MIRNYLKIAIRNIFKHKAFSIINVTGLAVGIACSVLILLFVSHELNYDRFHEKAGRIQRIAVRASIGNTQIRQTSSSAETFRKLLLDFPEIEAGVKFLRLGDVPVMAGDRTFSESRMYAVDKTFYEIFTVPLIEGSPKSVLANPNTMVLSKASALKYFGTTEAVGKVLRVNFPWAGNIRDFEITGVSENMPAQLALPLRHPDLIGLVSGLCQRQRLVGK